MECQSRNASSAFPIFLNRFRVTTVYMMLNQKSSGSFVLFCSKNVHPAHPEHYLGNVNIPHIPTFSPHFRKSLHILPAWTKFVQIFIFFHPISRFEPCFCLQKSPLRRFFRQSGTKMMLFTGCRPPAERRSRWRRAAYPCRGRPGRPPYPPGSPRCRRSRW